MGLMNAILLIFRKTFASRYRLAQYKLDLRIDAAQIIRCPFLDLFPQIGWNSEKKGLALFRGHNQV
jgi:hypothetical protein